MEGGTLKGGGVVSPVVAAHQTPGASCHALSELREEGHPPVTGGHLERERERREGRRE